MSKPVKLKRFLVFCFADYYPYGGLNDLQDEFEDKEEALDFAKKRTDDNVSVFDTVENILIFSK